VRLRQFASELVERVDSWQLFGPASLFSEAAEWSFEVAYKLKYCAGRMSENLGALNDFETTYHQFAEG
jgi:hypothetical protein